jgi:hypothetical protein
VHLSQACLGKQTNLCNPRSEREIARYARDDPQFSLFSIIGNLRKFFNS